MTKFTNDTEALEFAQRYANTRGVEMVSFWSGFYDQWECYEAELFDAGNCEHRSPHKVQRVKPVN